MLGDLDKIIGHWKNKCSEKFEKTYGGDFPQLFTGGTSRKNIFQIFLNSKGTYTKMMIFNSGLWNEPLKIVDLFIYKLQNSKQQIIKSKFTLLSTIFE